MAGQVVAFFAGEHAAAASAIERALALNPNSAHAWMVSGWAQCMLNNPDSAIDSLRRGLRLSPLDPLDCLGQPARSAALAKARPEQFPEFQGHPPPEH
jgi:cytochrome c-type biogenesis protein CcmH/NrfG